jgi:hypothetical protein
MDVGSGHHAIETGRTRADLTPEELWLRYFSLGGVADVLQVEAYLAGILTLPRHEYDILAIAVNERLDELGIDGRLRYTFDPGDEPV